MQIDQLRRRFDLSVFMLVIEPTWPHGNVAFGRHPVRARPVAAIQARNIRVSRREIPAVRRGPARLAGDPVIVPDPANIRAGVAEEHGSGLQVAHDLPRVRPIVVGAVVDLAPFVDAAVVAVATVRTVEEDLENRAIAGQQLAELIAVVDEVLGTSVILVIAIPRREIDAESHALAGARLGYLLHDVATERTVLDRMLGVPRRPQTKAVMVLAGEDQSLHPAALGGAHDLVCVKIGGIEHRRRLVPVAPLAIRERVHGEMQETVELELVPGELTGSRERREGSRRIHEADRQRQPRERRARCDELASRDQTFDASATALSSDARS